MNPTQPPSRSPEAAPHDSQPAGSEIENGARKKELIYGALAFVTGFVVLPALIYVVGILLLGPYADGKSLWVFLGEFYNNLLHGVIRTWFIALSPYLAFWVVRLSFRRTWFGSNTNPPTDDSPPIAHTRPPEKRREPFIST